MKSSSKPDTLSRGELICALREYIAKNEVIPDFFESIDDNPDEHELCLEALQLAIEQGDLNALVFSHPDCTTYLLYLIERRRIDCFLGLSTYFHCLGLMQFTTMQPLKEEDQDLKTKAAFKWLPLVDQGQLTDHIEIYVERVVEQFARIGIHFDPLTLKDAIARLSPIDQWVYALSIERCGIGDQEKVIHFYRSVAENSSYIGKCDTWPGVPSSRVTYLIPSLGLYRYIMEHAFQNPILIRPMLGAVSDQTLIKLHEQQKHPVAFYHRYVKSNLKKVHGHRAGVLFAALHDLSHAFWGSLLSMEDRSFLLNQGSHFAKALIVQAEARDDKDVSAYLKKVMHKIYDFDLTPLPLYHDAEFRRENYLKLCFGHSVGGVSGIYFTGDYKTRRLGELVADRTFFLVCQKFHEGSDPYKIAAMLRAQALKRDSDFRDNRIISLIDAIASWSVASTPFSTPTLFGPPTLSRKLSIDYDAIGRLLETSPDSKTFWDVMQDQHYDDLLILIRELRLAYFEPYLPLSEKDRARLVAHIEKPSTLTEADICTPL